MNCCVNELRLQLDVTSPVISFTWVHAAYHHYKNRMQNLSRMICIEPQVLPHLLRNQDFATGHELVSLGGHNAVSGYFDSSLIEMRRFDVGLTFSLRRFWTCMLLWPAWSTWSRDSWIQRSKGKPGYKWSKNSKFPLSWFAQRKVRGTMERRARPSSATSSKLETLKCSTLTFGLYSLILTCFLPTIRTGWSRIFSLSLFVENVLLGIDKVEKKLTPVVVEHTRRLGQVSPDLHTWCLSSGEQFRLPVLFVLYVVFFVLAQILEKSSDLKTHQTFSQVITLLKVCKEKAVECLFR